MNDRRNDTLYTGVTADPRRRVGQHKVGEGSEFVQRYSLTPLVFYEAHDEITGAIQRETNIKDWPRAWKVRLLERMNPAWHDLNPGLTV